MRRTILNAVFFLSAIGSWLLPGFVTAQDVQWRADYASARREAADKGRPLILDFGTQNCYYCNKLDATTFRDPNVAGLMNERFIPLKIEADRESGYWLASNLQIVAYPTIVLAAADGKIIDVHKGYMDPSQFLAYLQRNQPRPVELDWMVRDQQEASRAIQANDYARAIHLLKKIIEDESVRDRPVQVQARRTLQEIETQATARLNLARQLADKGQTSEAMQAISDLVRAYNGTLTSAEGGKLLKSLATSVDNRNRQARVLLAKKLLAQAKEDYAAQQYICCLERLELLTTTFADLAEGSEAMELSIKIRQNPEWMLRACELMSTRLGSLYLSLADTWLQKGQPQQAVLCLEKVVQLFPGTKQADRAIEMLSQIQGQPTRPFDRVEFKTP